MSVLLPFWDAILATLGSILVGWLLSRTEYIRAWRENRRMHREQRDAMYECFSGFVGKMDTLHDNVRKLATQIKNVDSALTKQDKVLSTLLAITLAEFEASEAPKFVCDSEGRNLNINGAYATLIGTGKEELLDFRWRSFIPPMELTAYLHRFSCAVADRRKFEDEITMRKRNGTYLRAHVYMMPFPPDGGEITHWVGILTEIPFPM